MNLIAQPIDRVPFPWVRLSAVQNLLENIHPGVRQVQGQERTWRNRVGPYRVVYDLYEDEQLVVIFKVDRRSESTYRF